MKIIIVFFALTVLLSGCTPAVDPPAGAMELAQTVVTDVEATAVPAAPPVDVIPESIPTLIPLEQRPRPAYNGGSVLFSSAAVTLADQCALRDAALTLGHSPALQGVEIRSGESWSFNEHVVVANECNGVEAIAQVVTYAAEALRGVSVRCTCEGVTGTGGFPEQAHITISPDTDIIITNSYPFRVWLYTSVVPSTGLVTAQIIPERDTGE